MSISRGRVRSVIVVALVAALALATASARGGTAPPPPNDDFANAALLIGQHDRASGNTDGATAQPGEPNHAGFPARHSAWYRWKAPQQRGTVSIATCASDFDTVLGVYKGSTLASLRKVKSSDDSLFCPGTVVKQSRVKFETDPGTTYRIAVDGSGGRTGHAVVTVDFEPEPRVLPGTYRGFTEFPDRKEISLEVARGIRKLRSFEFTQKLECTQGRFPVGEFIFRNTTIKGIELKRTEDGAHFRDRVRGSFEGGGRFTIKVEGDLIAPDRARGKLDVEVELPDDVSCENFFGAVRWTAKHRG